ncbi:hypothetical protein D5086_019194 [Populus alba]|uniref:Uncharacterized protein n=1 Tax=Populus alba TaxID=43335 RepID=A0ACC4BH81_POPAL
MNLLSSAFADSDDPTPKSSADNPDPPTLEPTCDSVFSAVDHDRDGDTGSLIKRESLNVRYSRFDAQVRALQCDLDTYCCEPVDKEDYEKWRSEGLVIEEKNEEIKRLIRENEVVKGIYNEVAPSKVDNQSCWSRYFYRMFKLKQAEEARALLVKRAISGDEEEDLSWDFDGEEEEGNGVLSKGKLSKDGDVVSSYSFQEEEDVGWDEIEDIGSNDESKVGAAGSNSKCWYRQS